MEEDEPLGSIAPDWPEELDRYVDALGEPRLVHRVPAKRLFRRVLTGTGLIIAGVGINYIYWLLLGGPIIPDKFILLLLFGTPISGFILLYMAYRDRGLWVFVYPTGVLRWQRGKLVAFSWDETSAIQWHRVAKSDPFEIRYDMEGEPEAAWLPLSQVGSWFLGSQLYIRRSDDTTALIPNSVDAYDELCRVIQVETFAKYWPEKWDLYCAGKAVEFGPVKLSRTGIKTGDDVLLWSQVGEVKVSSNKLVIHKAEKWRAWKEVAIAEVLNPHIFLAMVEYVKGQGGAAVKKVDEDQQNDN